MTSALKKRKLPDENRLFNPGWEEEFFVVEENKACICLICYSSINSMKKSNLSEHFTSKHKMYNEKYPLNTDVRSAKLMSLKSARKSQKQFMTSFKTDQAANGTVASFKISWMVARAKKPYSDVELIKKCCEVLVEELADNSDQKMLNKIKAVPLSADTAARRISSSIVDVNEQISKMLCNCDAIAIAVDESTDIRDVVQCCIFVRAINNDFKVTEDLLHLYPLTGKTRGEDVLDCVMETLKNFNIPLQLVLSLTTDGAPSMTDKNTGFTSLFKKHPETGDDVISFHCIIHQENLAALHSDMADAVMKDVVDIVNFIRAHALNHREFCKLLNEYDTHYGELVYHCQVRWLSKGAVLDHFFHLIEPIKTYLSERGNLPAKISDILVNLNDKKWMEQLAFLADITSHLNKLNLELQGKEKIITDMFTTVIAFENKLCLFHAHFKAGIVTHFERLQSLRNQKWKLKELDTFAICVESLKDEFEKRFSDFRSKKTIFSMVANPWLVQPDELKACLPFLPEDIIPESQMELIEIHSNDILKRQHLQIQMDVTRSILTFWKGVHQPNLRGVAKKVLSMFGSTYCCEQTFSVMNYVKNKNRNRLTCQHTSELIKAAVTGFEPDFQKLGKVGQAHPSH